MKIEIEEEEERKGEGISFTVMSIFHGNKVSFNISKKYLHFKFSFLFNRSDSRWNYYELQIIKLQIKVIM